MSREIAVLVTLVVYELVIMGVGLAARGRNRDGTDYFLAGRSLGPLVAAISASASSSSAWTLLGVSGFAYSAGVSAIWLFPACVGGFALNWYILAPALRRYSGAAHALTVTEVLAGGATSRTRRAISLLGALVVLVFMTAYIASQFQGAGKTFSTTFDLPLWESVLIGASVVAFYTLLGGFWAVSVTDTIQGLVMAVTAVLLPAAALIAVGAAGGLVAGMSSVDQAGFLDPLGNAGVASGTGFVIGLLGIGLGYPGQPHVVNRFMALRPGHHELVHARRIAMGWAVIVYSGMILLGWAGRVLFPTLDDAEVVFITVANELCHPIIAGVMLAAVLSAIMSTADSQLLVAASALTHDLPRSRLEGAPLVAQSRLVVFVLCVTATVAALWGPQEIFSPVLIAWAAMGATFGPVLLAGVLRGPVPPGRALFAMSAGLILTIAGAWFHLQMATPWGATAERVLPFVVALAISLAPARRRPR